MSSTITALTSGGGLAMAGDTSGQLQLLTNNGTAAVTIDTSQNVGINQTSPTVIATAKQLAIKAPTNGDALFVSQNSNGLTTFIAGYYGVTAGPDKPVVGSYSNDPVAFITNNTERMRIDSAGAVIIGKTVSTIGTVGVYIGGSGIIQATRSGDAVMNLNRLSSNGTNISFRRDDAEVGSVSVTTTATTYNTSSDYRLKDSIAPMTGALATVSALKPVTYKWKADGSDGQGFIAHELAEVVPDCVTGEKDAVETVDELDDEGNKIGTKEVPKYQGIDTSFLVATLTAAIQELNAKVDAQALEIQALKGVA